MFNNGTGLVQHESLRPSWPERGFGTGLAVLDICAWRDCTVAAVVATSGVVQCSVVSGFHMSSML